MKKSIKKLEIFSLVDTRRVGERTFVDTIDLYNWAIRREPEQAQIILKWIKTYDSNWQYDN